MQWRLLPVVPGVEGGTCGDGCLGIANRAVPCGVKELLGGFFRLSSGLP